MLKTPLLHPTLLATLSGIGHGGRLVIADAHFPVLTAANPAAQIVHLNLKRGMVTVSDVLEPVIAVAEIEAVTMMDSPDGSSVQAHQDFHQLLPASVPTALVDRWSFYDEAHASNIALVVATGDERPCSNLILTIGVQTD